MFRNIELRGYNKHSKKLYGFESCYLLDDEIAKNKFYLRDETKIDAHNNTIIKLYRFMTSEPMSYENSLSYDLHCPVCGGELRVHGLPIDSRAHALYKCTHCSKEKKS